MKERPRHPSPQGRVSSTPGNRARPAPGGALPPTPVGRSPRAPPAPCWVPAAPPGTRARGEDAERKLTAHPVHRARGPAKARQGQEVGVARGAAAAAGCGLRLRDAAAGCGCGAGAAAPEPRPVGRPPTCTRAARGLCALEPGRPPAPGMAQESPEGLVRAWPPSLRRAPSQGRTVGDPAVAPTLRPPSPLACARRLEAYRRRHFPALPRLAAKAPARTPLQGRLSSVQGAPKERDLTPFPAVGTPGARRQAVRGKFDAGQRVPPRALFAWILRQP